MQRLWILLCFLLLFLSCRTEDKIPLKIASHTLLVEIADSPGERQKGLMHRESLNRGEGMLFVFSDDEPRNFWMKNTLIPLSIAYIDKNGIIIDILDMEPLDLSPVPSSGPARYALEVNQGEFRYRNILVGDKVDIPEKYR